MSDKKVSMPRDQFVMAILPGLLDQNLGLRATEQSPKDASGDFELAYVVIGRGLTRSQPVDRPDQGGSDAGSATPGLRIAFGITGAEGVE